MAPEVGLEPTTSRLTAARSTIELLWIPNGRAIYNVLVKSVKLNLSVRFAWGLTPPPEIADSTSPGRRWPGCGLRLFKIKHNRVPGSSAPRELVFAPISAF